MNLNCGAGVLEFNADVGCLNPRYRRKFDGYEIRADFCWQQWPFDLARLTIAAPRRFDYLTPTHVGVQTICQCDCGLRDALCQTRLYDLTSEFIAVASMTPTGCRFANFWFWSVHVYTKVEVDAIA